MLSRFQTKPEAFKSSGQVLVYVRCGGPRLRFSRTTTSTEHVNSTFHIYWRCSESFLRRGIRHHKSHARVQVKGSSDCRIQCLTLSCSGATLGNHWAIQFLSESNRAYRVQSKEAMGTIFTVLGLGIWCCISNPQPPNGRADTLSPLLQDRIKLVIVWRNRKTMMLPGSRSCFLPSQKLLAFFSILSANSCISHIATKKWSWKHLDFLETS